VDDLTKAARLENALLVDGYRFETILITDNLFNFDLKEEPDLAVLWFPTTSPEALPEFEAMVFSVQKKGNPAPLPVLFIIDQYGVDWVEPGFKLGITDILMRPIHPLILRQRVRLLLQGRQTEQAVIRYQLSEQALKTEKQRLFNVLDLLPAFVYLQNFDYSVSFANHTFIDLFGEPQNRKCFEILNGRSSPCSDCPTMQTLQTGVPHEWEWTSGKGQTYRIYDNRYIDHAGLAQVLEIGIDITDLKYSQDELEEEKERFRTIADFTYDWEYWIDNNGNLIYNSPACERITGRPAPTFVESPSLLLDIVHPDDRAAVDQHFHHELASQESAGLDFRILTPSGEERWIGHMCQPVYRQDGELSGRRISNRDITERRLAQQTSIRAERLAAMGRLIASLAHEINNPLQAMYSNIELAMDFPLDAHEKQIYLNVVRKETERLMRIIKTILEYSRPRKIEFEMVEVSTFIHTALSLAQKQLHLANVDVFVDLPSDLPRLMVSHDQLVQVCLNLMINAAENMRNGGRLEIRAAIQENQLEITFADTGNGISAADLELIFEPFFTTKKDGTGLGLAISQSIIQQHGGKLTVQSPTGKGSVFGIVLPLPITNP
jgi:PAS domain S-box-containing protein